MKAAITTWIKRSLVVTGENYPTIDWLNESCLQSSPKGHNSVYDEVNVRVWYWQRQTIFFLFHILSAPDMTTCVWQSIINKGNLCWWPNKNRILWICLDWLWRSGICIDKVHCHNVYCVTDTCSIISCFNIIIAWTW